MQKKGNINSALCLQTNKMSSNFTKPKKSNTVCKQCLQKVFTNNTVCKKIYGDLIKTAAIKTNKWRCDRTWFNADN